MQEFIEAFLAATNYAATTKESYRHVLGRLGEWLAERGKTFDELTGPLFVEWVNGNEWGDNMRRLASYAVRSFMLWLGYGRNHPIFAVAVPRDNSAPGRSLDMDGLRALLESFDLNKPVGWRNLALVTLMVDTGLRVSEVCNLELARVDLRAHRLTCLVKRSRWQVKVFSEETAQVLSVWIEQRQQIAQPGVKTLFVSVGGIHPGTALSRDGLKIQFRRFGQRANLGALSPHDLRRTMAMLLTNEGAPSRLVQALGGWESIKMVERYTRGLTADQIDRYSPLKEIIKFDQLKDRTSVL